jgi:hypothetical protein
VPLANGAPFTAPQIAQIEAECTSGPLAAQLAESVSVSSAWQVVAALNAPGKVQTDVLPRESVSAKDALAFLEHGDYATLTAAARDHLSLMAAVGTMELLSPHDRSQDSAVKRALLSYFPPSTVSGAVLAQFMLRPASRIEMLFGPGATLTEAELVAVWIGS